MHLSTWVEVWGLINSREFAPWLWFERLSWLVAVAGFPFLVYQVRVLQLEQRRLADALAMQPAIDFGFLPDDRLLREVVRWAQNVRASRDPYRRLWRWTRLGPRRVFPPEPSRALLPNEYAVEAKWSPEQDVSMPIPVKFVAVNAGARTARNVRFYLQLGSGEGAETKNPPPRRYAPGCGSAVRDRDPCAARFDRDTDSGDG